MGILSWIVIGIVIGSVARLIMAGPPAGGILVAIPVCVGGALLGGMLGIVFAGGSAVEMNTFGILAAIGGALIVMLCYRSYALRDGKSLASR